MLRPITGMGSIALGIVFGLLLIVDIPMSVRVGAFAGVYVPAFLAVAGIGFGLYLIATKDQR